MYWTLLPHLNACIASGRLILLDIEQDRYSAVPADIAGPAITWLQGSDESPAPEAFVALLRRIRGLCATAQLNRHDLTNVAVPTIATNPETGNNSTFRAIVSVFGTVAITWAELRLRKLRAILAARERMRRVGASLDADTMRLRSHEFASARRWCPIRPNCLLDSLAFDRWAECPRDARLVFGVVGNPFEAHCWVQRHADLLNDSHDRVLRFEPILSV